MIYFLLPTLIILLCLSYRINQKDIGAPAVIFTLSFCFCSLWATVYSKEWSLELEMATYLVIVLGVADFILTSYLYRKILKRIRIKQKDRNFKEDNNTENWKIIIFIGIEVLSIICTIICLKKMTGSLVLASAIAQYRDSIVFGNVEKTFPKILTIVRIIVNGSGYWFAYIFANKLVSNRKINIFVLIALLLSVINTLILGGRN